jgi:UDP-N-acetylmuramoyl-L-alanyl-D-glutamate--2,6-diaminopimelate ligase
MLGDTIAKKKTYSILTNADYRAQDISLTTQGTIFTIEDLHIKFSLIGNFNLSNGLAVHAALKELGFEKNIFAPLFSKLSPLIGRFELLKGPEDRVGIVDYAHTPDGLEKVLVTLKELKKEKNSLIVFFGCGGNRDKTKRPIMGSIASTYADRIIITSDNPRNESPETICEDIVKGVSNQENNKIIVDRKNAIAHAISIRNKGDTIVIAGKGHEQYQIIGDQKIHFFDQVILRELFDK